MNLLKLNIISFKSKQNLDNWSQNYIKIKIKYDNYYIEIPFIKNNNKPIFNEEFILKYTENIPLSIKVYETNNTFNDIELYNEMRFKLNKKSYINNELKYYYEIIYNNEKELLLKNYFNILVINTKSSKIEKIKKIINNNIY